MAGIPICKSGVAMRGDSLIAPEEVRREMVMVCQKERKMTSLMARTLMKGLWAATVGEVRSWM